MKLGQAIEEKYTEGSKILLRKQNSGLVIEIYSFPSASFFKAAGERKILNEAGFSSDKTDFVYSFVFSCRV